MTKETYDTAALEQQATRLLDWTLTKSIPLWSTVGIHKSGVTHEALDFAGEVVKHSRVRVRVVARQLYVFSLAKCLGWKSDQLDALIESHFNALDSSCRRVDGLFGQVFELDSQRLSNDNYTLYDTAFALLGFASARQHLNQTVVDAAIYRTIDSLDQVAAHPAGGFQETIAATERLQNPHMHLFESLLALRENEFPGEIETRIERLREFISGTFFDQNVHIVHEKASDKEAESHSYEPGHSMEWVWLLTWYARQRTQSTELFAAALYHRALGSLDENGFACMVANASSDSPDMSKRLWSQAELLKAYVSIALTENGDRRQQAIDAATGLCRNIYDHWLAPAVPGGWLDHLDFSGDVIAKNMPASTGYHLYGAIAFAINNITGMHRVEN